MDQKDSFLQSAVAKMGAAWLGNLQGWQLILVVVGIWLGLIVFLCFLLTRINYRVGPKHLKVTLLGVPIRRIRLDNIRALHTRRPRLAEKWHNMLFPTMDRILVIEKRRGLIKRLVITPEQRYVFKAELDRAIRAHVGLRPALTLADVSTFEQAQTAATRAAVQETEAGQKPRETQA
jgi:hypothetical protein